MSAGHDEPFGAMIGDSVSLTIVGRVISYEPNGRLRVALFPDSGSSAAVVVPRADVRPWPEPGRHFDRACALAPMPHRHEGGAIVLPAAGL